MGKIGRNDPCPCGSGKKFKKCHIGKKKSNDGFNAGKQHELNLLRLERLVAEMKRMQK